MAGLPLSSQPSSTGPTRPASVSRSARESAARQRLRQLGRLGRTFSLRIAAAGPGEWDAPRGESWTLREIADHLTGIRWYADQVGRL